MYTKQEIHLQALQLAEQGKELRLQKERELKLKQLEEERKKINMPVEEEIKILIRMLSKEKPGLDIKFLEKELCMALERKRNEQEKK